MPNLPNGSKGGFEPGLTRLRVRHSTTELPRSTGVCRFVLATPFMAARSPRSWLHIMQTESPPGYGRRLQCYAYQTSCFMTISHNRGFIVHIRPYAVPSTRIMINDMISLHELWQYFLRESLHLPEVV